MRGEGTEKHQVQAQIPETTTGSPETGREGRGIGWLKPIPLGSLLIVGWSFWLVVMGGVVYWTERSAGTKKRFYALAVKTARLQLQLRAVGVRRYEARTGVLPRTLRECAEDTPRLWDVLASSPELHWWGEWVVAEPWWPWRKQASTTGTEGTTASARPAPPDVSLDFFGLPIVYTRGQKTRRAPGWLSSVDPLAPAVVAFISRTGGMPPEAKHPFALGSLFLEDCLSAERRAEWKAGVWLVIFLLGLAGIPTAGFILHRRSERQPESRVVRVVSRVLAALVLLMGIPTISATCYISASFRSTYLSRADRLALLERAVRRGEVPPETAQLARRFLEGES